MAYRNFYLAIENVALPTAKRNLLYSEFAAVGPAAPQPQKTEAWKVRADGNAVIYEMMYNEDNFCADAALAWLAALFGISVSQISLTTAIVSYTTGINSFVITLSSGGAERVKFIAWAGSRHPGRRAAWKVSGT